MDITSYILGKNAGGGGGTPNLQTKSVTITENTTTNIQPDTGYDGLSAVNVTTNVSGGDTPTKGAIFSDYDNDGYPHTATIIGITTIPTGFLYTYSASNSCTGHIENLILPNNLTQINEYAFYNMRSEKISNLPNTVTSIGSNAFYSNYKLAIKTIPETITLITQRSFQYCTSLTQLSMNVTTIEGSATGNPAFLGCTNIVAIWLGDKFTNSGSGYSGNYGLYIGGTNKLARIYINKPRATVESLPGYNYGFQGNTSQSAKDKIICNDDTGWLTKEQFDAIDWETYTP